MHFFQPQIQVALLSELISNPELQQTVNVLLFTRHRPPCRFRLLVCWALPAFRLLNQQYVSLTRSCPCLWHSFSRLLCAIDMFHPVLPLHPISSLHIRFSRCTMWDHCSICTHCVDILPNFYHKRWIHSSFAALLSPTRHHCTPRKLVLSFFPLFSWQCR